jgi:hypothetical protein
MTPVFIAAAPRSGTTFLGEFLSLHPQIAGWHEPYFIWQYKLARQDHDVLTKEMATSTVIEFIHKQFDIFSKKSRKPIIVEKTPVNALKIDFINAVFPDAKWIHLYRDGRAVINSLKIRYQRRYNIVNNMSLSKFLQDVSYTLKRQPFWYFRFMAIWYEITQQNHIKPYLSKDRKKVTFGPKYPGWEKDRAIMSDIEFMAKQWVECEHFIENSRRHINPANFIDIRYEDLISNPANHLEKICRHLDIDCQPYMQYTDRIHDTSKSIWKTGLTSKEIDLIMPIIKATQSNLGYAH